MTSAVALSGGLGLWLAALWLGACGPIDSCGDLREICDLCPATGQGLAARDSCVRTAATDDEDACDDRLELRTYEAFGCVAP